MTLRTLFSKSTIWMSLAFLVTYLLNSCGDPLNSVDKASEATSSSLQEEDPAAIRYISYDDDDEKNVNASGSGGFSVGGSGGTATNSTSSGRIVNSYSGGFANGGGRLDEGSNDDSATTSITYGDYQSSGFQYFEKMTEPEDVYVPEGQPFGFQFTAMGRFPLSYIWYKKTSSGKLVVGTDSTVFSKVEARISDAGEYFATVEDAEGHILTSRTVQLKVRPGEKPCEAGVYKMASEQANELIISSEAPSYWYNKSVTLPQLRHTYTRDMDCNELLTGDIFIGCTGEITFQCRNGVYKKLEGNCSCPQDSGG